MGLALLLGPGCQQGPAITYSGWTLPAPPAMGRPGIGDARVVQLVAEDDHTCVLLGDGEVACWGRLYGPYGQSPGRIPDLREVRSIALGDKHLCALHHDGTVSCGGDNRDNQLAREPRAEDQPFARVPGVAGVTAIFAGDSDTCVLSNEPGLTCWGASYTTKQEPGRRATHAQTLQLRRVSLSNYDNVWLTDSGQVRWWGAPLYFESHDGRYHAYPARPAEVRVPGPVRDVCASSWHSCAIAEAGTVHCWGYLGLGANRLGFPWNEEWWPPYHEFATIREIDAPPAVIDVADAAELACGDYHTCARLSSGGIQCWGARGQQGAGPSKPGEPENSAHAVVGVTDAVRVAAGGAHTCAVLASGKIVCWGDLPFIDGEASLREVPVEVPPGSLDTRGPLLGEIGVSDLAADAATVLASIETNGFDGAVVVRYGTAADLTNAATTAPASISGAGVRDANLRLTALQSATQYYFQLVVTNPYGESRSPILSFATR